MSAPTRPYRRTSFLTAYAGAPDAPDAVLCVVRNLSRRGACLSVPAAHNLPATLDLDIGGRRPRRARVAWRRADHVGVEFLPGAGGDPRTPS